MSAEPESEGPDCGPVTFNVYRLPARLDVGEASEQATPRRRLERVRARLDRFWYRVRFIVAEIIGVIRRSRDVGAARHQVLLPDADDLPANVPRVSTPGRVFDFEAARRRRAPGSSDPVATKLTGA